MSRLAFTALLSILLQAVAAQQLPANGARLNYTQVMFDYPAITGAQLYILQIADTADISFKQPVAEKYDSAPAILISNLKFGKKYRWRYAAFTKGKKPDWQGPYFFEILPNPYVNLYRVKVLLNDTAHNAKGLVAIDYLRSIIDRSGNTVLFVPRPQDQFRKNADVRDLCLTKYGTITYLAGQMAAEYNLGDSALWFAPPLMKNPRFQAFGDFFHHDLKRTAADRYMVLGSDYVLKKIPAWFNLQRVLSDTSIMQNFSGMEQGARVVRTKSGFTISIGERDTTLLVNMESIVEYDKENHVMWEWKADNYLRDEDIFWPSFNLGGQVNQQLAHLNAFSQDAKKEYVYASFRNLNRVVKIEKKSGRVVDAWGYKTVHDTTGFLRLQHGVNVLPDNNIAVFNNGDTTMPGVPAAVIVFSQKGNTAENILWKFDCVLGPAGTNTSLRGGNVDALYNTNYLVSMGAVNRVFEVTQQKQLVWHAVAEQYIDTKGWVPMETYRAHYSSSLYPCYFAVQPLTVNGKMGFKIFNTGSEADSYTLSQVSSAIGNVKNLHTDAIAPGASAWFEVPISTGEKIEVTVQSATNPNQTRKISISSN